MRSFLIFTALTLSTLLNCAQAEWLCTHPQLCQLAEDYFKATNSEVPALKKAISIDGDPHHIEPTSAEVKAMTKALVVLAAPAELHPWSRQIVEIRKKQQLQTIEFPLANGKQLGYEQASPESLAHFWLYPKIHCQYWDYLHQKLAKAATLPTCPQLEFEEKLKGVASKVSLPIILSHDALVPLFRSWGIDAHAIKGSGHHEEPRPAQLKELQRLLQKNEKVVWLIESRISFPSALKKMQRTNDIKLELDTSGDYPFIGLHPLQRLELFFAKL